jgi:hypothetical protein
MPAALARFLSAVPSLAPKAAMYDSLDAAAAAHRRPAAELLAEVERAVLGEEMRDVLLREGARRRERHDRLQARGRRAWRWPGSGTCR